jgi:hypothetical protein
LPEIHFSKRGHYNMKQTEEKKEREVYIAPVVSDIAPVTLTKVQGADSTDGPEDPSGFEP